MKDSSQPPNQAPTEEEVILTLGYASFEAQETEATLHLAMSVILKLSIAESIEHLKLIYSKKTLGQLLTLVRKEIGIDPSFDTFITDYIEQRNFIIHNISRCSGFSLFTDDGRQKLMNFLTRFRYINRKVKMTFVALTEAWLEILSPGVKHDEKFKDFYGSDLYKEIQHDFIPELGRIFGQKNLNSST